MKFTYRITTAIGGGSSSALGAGIPGLAEAAAEIKARVSIAVRTTAFDIQAEAQNNAAVDTGCMKSSIFVRTADTDGYSAAASAAEADFEAARASGKTPKGRDVDKEAAVPIFEASDTPEVSDDMHAIIAVAAKYGYYVEYGTSRQSAQPFLSPAVQSQEDKFIAAVTAAVQGSNV